MRQVIDSETRAENESERLNADLVRSQAAEQVARSDLERALAESGAARARLESYERAAWDARHRLREAETQSRDVEVAEMEARLGLESTREALLVELAGIGSPGLEALRAEASGAATPDAAPRDAALRAADPAPASGQPAEQIPEADVLADDLESALDAAITAWHAAPSGGAEAPVPLPVTKLATLRRRYHELGATNPFAATEFHEVNERLTALEGQRADLERAIGATRQLIEDLAVLVATRFRDTFAALEGAFERQFQQLFDGGDAQLTLTTPEDLSVTGIEITARPPGKKRQALAMLSGGERALTAVALLFAMLEVRPVPFCVLDEVDAALDEANVGRFGAALRGLASDIQFVVITHNRATIEAADALYGVTVGDDAVSRVISLRISDVGAAEEPDRLIERDAPAAAAAS
ncbi:MAG: hypothetical protein H0W07_01315 [Chloroflexi bacterium]|nr:hypothetical protein [Chloroflexota bacterium]